MPDYDITSPDGKTYRVTAPEGASQDEILAFAQSHHEQTAKPDHSMEAVNPEPKERWSLDPTTGMMMPNIDVQNTLEGIGSGMVRTARGIGNIETKILNHLPTGKYLTKAMDAIRPSWAFDTSDAALDAQDEIDKALNNTGSGKLGQVLGSAAMGSAATAGTGALESGSMALAPVARTALPFARSAVEGALNGAATAPSNEQGTGALEGAAAGTAVHGALSGAGRLVRGLVKKSAAAEDLQHLAAQNGHDMFIPLAQAAEDSGISGKMKGFYNEALPLLPGATGAIRKQEDSALQVFRQMALQEADPTGASLAADAAKDPHTARLALKDAFDDAYRTTVGSYQFNVPPDFKDRVAKKILAEMPNADATTVEKVSKLVDEQMSRYASGKADIAGENLLNAKDGSIALAKKLNPVERQALEHGVGAYGDLIEDELSQGSSKQNLADLDKFKSLAEPYDAYTQLSKAIRASKADSGRFTPAQLARAAGDTGTVHHLATSANEVLGNPAVAPSTAGRVFAYSLGGLGGYKNPALLGGALLGANTLASKTAQKALMGDTAAQQALTDLLENHPDMTDAVGTVVRTMAAQQAGAGNGGPKLD